MPVGSPARAPGQVPGRTPAARSSEVSTLVPPTRAVMLDIGEDAGALVLDAGPDREGLEVEVLRDGAATDRRHVYVLRRELPGGRRYAAVFPSLPPGRYVVLDVDGSPGPAVTVEAGRVARGWWGDRGSVDRRGPDS